ncbi:MAG TPA: hypothetical protein VF699_03275 [Caulobacteraceae bacterium]|jgi:hypothetical protein
MSKTEAVQALEHARVPVHRFVGAPDGLPQRRAHGRLAVLRALGRRAGRELAAYGETLGRLQKPF